jgi:ribosomal protein S18 acetylase RimI-like enzyme
VVIRLLASLRRQASAGSHLAIDFALTAETADARASREALQARVAAVGEPFAFEIPKAELGGLLRGAGWDVQGAVDPRGVAMASSTSPTVFVTATPAHAGASAQPVVQLRPMTAAEFDDWRSPLVLAYAADHVRVGNWSEQDAPGLADSQLTSLLPQGVDTPGMLVMVGENAAGQPVGHLWLALGPRPGSGADAYIYDIEVDAQQRGQGYGRELLRAAEAEAAEHGATAIGLTVFGDNQVARNLYESAGYASTTISMRKALPGGDGHE